MSAAPPLLRLVRDDDPPLRPPHDPLDSLSQLQALRNEVGVLTAELSTLRHVHESHSVHLSKINEELRLAARLQQDFLPKTLPQVGRVRFHTLFRPAGFVSGDFYDVIRLDENHVGFYIADAVGHGVPAALLTMFIKHALITKQIVPGGYRLLSAEETMTLLNEKLLEQQLSSATFATAVYGVINVQTLKVQFARGGHPLPLLFGANGQIKPIPCDGGLLGVFHEETFTQQTVQLSPGDRVLMFTDGFEVLFPEDRNAEQQRWMQELDVRRFLPAQQLLKEYSELIDQQCGDRLPKDDLTMLMLEVPPQQPLIKPAAAIR